MVEQGALVSTAYPGEGLTCSGSGQRDAIGQIFGSDHCQGFGEHPGGWQMRGQIGGPTVSGYLFDPGD